MKTGKRTGLLLLLLHGFYAVMAQSKPVTPNPYKTIDAIAVKIPVANTTSPKEIAAYISQKFTSDADRVRAAFVWVASNLSYDINNMYAINFYESEADKIKKALTTHTGICEHFALLFAAICHECGMEAYTITGYTKQNGFTDYIPHMWVAVKLNNNWSLYDPTWGSGYMQQKKFVHALNNNFYNAAPEKLIKTHMPFDYLWQLLPTPVTSAEFNSSKTSGDKNRPYFNFNDSIIYYNKLSKKEQLQATAQRVEKNGLSNAMLFDYLRHIKVDLENMNIQEQNAKQQEAVDAFNNLSDTFNDGVVLINKYIDYKNHQFTPAKTDDEIREMFNKADWLFAAVDTNLKRIDDSYPNIASGKKNLQKLLNNLKPQLIEQRNWLDTYMIKPKNKRKSMFYERTVTWFGIPLK